jgi:hypothetical protein
MVPDRAPPATGTKLPFAHTLVRVSVDDKNLETKIPASIVANATHWDLHLAIMRKFELPPNLVIAVKNVHGDALCLRDEVKPVQYAIELLTLQQKSETYFLSVTKGREQPNLKTSIPVIRAETNQLLCRQPYFGDNALKIERHKKWTTETLLLPLYAFHDLDPHMQTPAGTPPFVVYNCFGRPVVFQNHKRRDLIYNILHHRYYIVCNLEQLSVSISSRCRAIRELISTERTYLAFLRTFRSSFGSELRAMNAILHKSAKCPKGTDPMMEIFDGVRKITTVHAKIAEVLLG